MATTRYIDDTDMARAKALWKENGRPVVAGIVLGLSAIAGYQFWQWHLKSQGESASLLFDQLQQGELTRTSAEAIAEQLTAQYKATPYVIHAAFAVARIAVEDGDFDAAAVHLRRALEQTEDVGLLHIGRLRLASVLNAAGKSEEAVALLLIQDQGSFAGRYAELLGDAYARLGELEKAREFYQKSLQQAGDRGDNLVRFKLDNL